MYWLLRGAFATLTLMSQVHRQVEPDSSSRGGEIKTYRRSRKECDGTGEWVSKGL